MVYLLPGNFSLRKRLSSASLLIVAVLGLLPDLRDELVGGQADDHLVTHLEALLEEPPVPGVDVVERPAGRDLPEPQFETRPGSARSFK